MPSYANTYVEGKTLRTRACLRIRRSPRGVLPSSPRRVPLTRPPSTSRRGDLTVPYRWCSRHCAAPTVQQCITGVPNIQQKGATRNSTKDTPQHQHSFVGPFSTRHSLPGQPFSGNSPPSRPLPTLSSPTSAPSVQTHTTVVGQPNVGPPHALLNNSGAQVLPSPSPSRTSAQAVHNRRTSWAQGEGAGSPSATSSNTTAKIGRGSSPRNPHFPVQPPCPLRGRAPRQSPPPLTTHSLNQSQPAISPIIPPTFLDQR